MTMTDPIADMLTRMRNAITAKHRSVVIPNSKMKTRIAAILKEEGHIEDFKVTPDRKQGLLRIEFKFVGEGGTQNVIRGLKRISKPGRRRYVSADEVPKVLNGMGTAILTTSRGILTDRECRRQRIGGEVLCEVW
ncbi:MAG: 30S ribosomal protein S8 [Nitrospinota bacterium]